MRHATLISSLALALTLASLAKAQDAPTQNCVNLMQIDHTTVVDNNTILFFMKGDAVYHNSLPQSCPGLKTQDKFMYRVSLQKLCRVDVVTVITDMGFGFIPGASCGLGEFQEITPAMADALVDDAQP